MDDLIELLKTRRSSKLGSLTGPGPSPEQIETILRIASRVPDHGKMAPWYFIVLAGENRLQAGEILRKAYADENPGAAEAKLDLEMERFTRAPLVIAVVSRIKFGKHPQWEQILSAGAACMNLCLAANALGYGSNWLTEWYCYNLPFKTALGLDVRDNIAGFIYIGTKTDVAEERERPDLSEITTYWTAGHALNKGDIYGNKNDAPPSAGFTPL